MEKERDKEKHLYLTGIVKDVHAKLRNKFKRSGNFDEVWKEHCQNEGVLQQYAHAMHELATDIWASNNTETRIEWCRNACAEYFLKDGMEKVLNKEKRRKQYEEKSHIDNNSSNSDADRQPSREHSLPEYMDEQNKDTEKLCAAGGDDVEKCTLHTQHLILPPFQGQISLLDVGSCYNAFQHFEEFIALGIDLSPAKESVLKCDFLDMDISENNFSNEKLQTHILTLKSPVESLPSDSFHVVVFSLVLEYLPSCKQRWICCQKAHRLLKTNGLLIIITPDSHHQNKNAPMMKSWKIAIESLGFHRWRYEKQQHLHCMIFRKVLSESKLSWRDSVCDISADMLYIPQDFNAIDDDSDMYYEMAKENVRTEEDELLIQEGFSELPVIFDED